jgi:hypothetical protein
MNVWVAWTQAQRAVGHPQHGIPHCIVDSLPVSLDGQGQAKEEADDDKLGPDQLDDGRGNNRPVVGTMNLGIGTTFSHGDDKLPGLGISPGERFKTRLRCQCTGQLLRRWRDPLLLRYWRDPSSLLRNWRDPYTPQEVEGSKTGA